MDKKYFRDYWANLRKNNPEKIREYQDRRNTKRRARTTKVGEPRRPRGEIDHQALALVGKRGCPKCKRILTPEDFYPKAGWGRQCKRCAAERAKAYYHKNAERVRMNIYKNSKRHVHKVRARSMVHSYLKKGALHKATACEGCGRNDLPLQGHHEDYSQPLKVQWLCQGCHAEADRLLGV